MKNKFLQIKNATNESVDFYVYGDIVSDTDWKWDESDVMPKDIKNLLDEHEGKHINLYVNSGGGSVFAGLGIKAMLERAKEKGSHIVAHIDALAASIASVLIFGASEVRMPSNAYLMIHRAWSWQQGNASDMRKMAEDLEKIDEGILSTYEQNLKEGIKIETIKDMMDAETWMTGKEASQYFNITLTDSVEAVACTSEMYKNYKFVPSNLVLNKEQEVDSEEEEKEAEIEDLEAVQKQEIENLMITIDLT